MKLIIAGGRYYTDWEYFKKHTDIFFETNEIVEIVHGGATGVDSMAMRYALENNYQWKEFPVTKADWKKLGKSAGPIRNKQMGNYADSLLAFWDGFSRGTKSMIEIMEGLNKPVKIIFY